MSKPQNLKDVLVKKVIEILKNEKDIAGLLFPLWQAGHMFSEHEGNLVESAISAVVEESGIKDYQQKEDFHYLLIEHGYRGKGIVHQQIALIVEVAGKKYIVREGDGYEQLLTTEIPSDLL